MRGVQWVWSSLHERKLMSNLSENYGVKFKDPKKHHLKPPPYTHMETEPTYLYRAAGARQGGAA
jgi:hypothetical protein